MIHITKQQEPLYQELKEIEKEMRNSAEQAKIYENSLSLLNKTIKKNQLTMKQLDRIGGERSIYVPIGRAFLKKKKEETIKEFTGANQKLMASAKEMEQSIKYHTQKANEKYKILRQGTDRLTKK